MKQLLWCRIWLYTLPFINAAPRIEIDRRIVVVNLPLTITCTSEVTMTTTVIFLIKPAVAKGGCLSSGTCGSSYSIYSVTQNRAQRTTTLTISSVNSTADTGTWFCRQEGEGDSGDLNITQFARCEWFSSKQHLHLPDILSIRPGRNHQHTQSPWKHSESLQQTDLPHCRTVEHDSFDPPTYTRSETSNSIQFPVPVTSVAMQEISSDNEKVVQRLGTELTLTCVTSASFPTSTVSWSGLPSGKTPTITSTSGLLKTTTSSVTFTLSKNDQGRTVRCTASNIDGQTSPHSNRAVLEVQYGPDDNQVGLTKNPDVVAVEGRSLTLTCATLTSASPGVTFTFTYIDGSPVSGGVPGSVTGSAGNTWSQSLTFQPSRHKRTNQCTVRNTATGVQESQTIVLEVKYGPDSGEVQVSKSSTAVEMEPLGLICSTTNNVKPGVTFTWTVDWSEVSSGTGPIQGSSGGKWSQTLTLTPTRGQGSVGCTVINTVIARQESSSVDLDVNYPPDISLSPVEGPQNTDLTLTCTATGNPSSYSFEDFRQYWGDQLIQSRGGTQTGDRYSLDLPQVSYQDSGVYVCTVGNNVKQPSHKNTTVTVQASPVYTKDVDTTDPVGAEIGQTARLVRYIHCSPNFTSVSWHFNTTNTTTSRLSTDSSSVSSSPVHLDVYGTQVEMPGFKLVYTVTNFQQEHVGLYTVRVCNRVGCADSSLKLTVTGPPDAPTELLAWSDGPNSVRLSWKKGSNGGANQQFRVQYKKEADPWTYTQDLYGNNGEPFIQGHIQGLKPETLYFVKVQSINKYGNSSFTDVERVLTKVYVTEAPVQTAELSSLGVGAGIGIGVAICLLLLLVAVVVMVLLRRQARLCFQWTKRSQTTERNTESQEGSRPGQSVYDQLEKTGDDNYEKLAPVYHNSEPTSLA